MLEPPILVFLIYLSILTECVKAEDCLESPNTLKIVCRCPGNRTEWERQAKIKNCSKFHGINGCQKVEYHCLVNAYRNETIEICSTPRIIQAYCPIYRENKPNQDYNRPCQNLSSPFKCSGPYNSRESYKWQTCYEYVYNQSNMGNGIDQSTEACQEKGHTGTLDKSPKISNGWIAFCVLLALILGPVLMYGVCVLYHWKCKQEPIHKALCFFKSDVSSDIEETGMLGGSSANTNGTPITITPVGDQVELPGDRDDDKTTEETQILEASSANTTATLAPESDQVEISGNEDEDASEETELLEASSANATGTAASLTPDTVKMGIPGNRDSKDTQKFGASSANANATAATLTPDGDQVEIHGDREGDNTSEETQILEASSANGTTVTLAPEGNENDNASKETGLLEASSANTTATAATLPPDTKKMGIPGNEDDDAIEETGLLEASSANATVTMELNITTLTLKTEKMGMPVTNDQNQPDTVPYQLPSEVRPPEVLTWAIPIKERVKDVENDLNILKERLKFINAAPVKDLEFEITSIAEKIDMYFKRSYKNSVLGNQNRILHSKVDELEVKLQTFHQTLEEFRLDRKEDYLQRGNEIPSTLKTQDSVGQFHNMHMNKKKKGISISSTSKIKGKLQDEEDSADNSNVIKMFEDGDHEDISDEHNSKKEGDEQQLEDLMPEMKIKEAGERKFADGACNTSVSDAQSDEKDSSCEKQCMKSTLKDQVKALTKEYEEYKEKCGVALGELPKLQLKVSEIECDLSILARIHGLEKTENATDLDLPQIRKKIIKTKKFFNDMKNECELEQL